VDNAKLNLESLIDSAALRSFHFMVIGCCALTAMLDGFDTQSIAFVVPDIATAWSIEPARFAPVFGAGLFGGLLGAIAFGRAGDRFGRRPTLLLSVLLFAVGSLVTPAAGSLRELSAARLVTGIGLGGALPAAIALTSEYAPRHLRTTLVSLMFCGFPLGAVLGGLASAKLIAAFGWQSVFIVGGALPLALLPLLMAFLPESARFLAAKGRHEAVAGILASLRCLERWNGAGAGRPEPRARISSLFTRGRAAGTYLLWMTFFLSLLVTYFLINWIPVVAHRNGLDTATAVVAVAMLNLGSIVGSLVIARLADGSDRGSTIGWAYAIGAIGIALIGYTGGSGAWLCALTFVAGVCSIGAQLCTVALCSGFYDTSVRATGIGWSMGVGRIGAIAGPVLGGLLLGAGISSPVLFCIAGAASVGAAIAGFALKRFVLDRHPSAPVESSTAPAASDLLRRTG
jgi:AAHS family 4-hydroxybenzoate transporter-like MFS transporter